MGFALDSGYTPSTIQTLMSDVRININAQFGTTYTDETFIGTNFYKYFYALIQRLQECEIKTSEIFLRMQEYFNITNESIQRPNTTHPGIFDYFKSQGYFVSTKAPIDADAGKAFVCVDVVDNHARGKAMISSYANLVSGTADTITVGATAFTAQAGTATLGTATFQSAVSNAATAISLASQVNAHATAGALVEAQAIGAVVWLRAKAPGTGGNSVALAYTDNDSNVGASVSASTLLGGAPIPTGQLEYDLLKPVLCNIIKNCVVAGVISQGSESEEITLSNSQSFEFKYNLPNRIPIKLKLTTTLSENNQFTILSPDAQKALLFANINSRYKLGKNFEPQRYFSVVDAPWAAIVLLEYSTDGGTTWVTSIFNAAYDEVLTFALTDITLVED